MAQIIITPQGLDKARAFLKSLGDKVTDLRRPFKSFGVHMVRSVTLNFEQGGRPVRWIPSRRASLTGGKTLIQAARLMRSVTSKVVGTNAVAVGTNVLYGAVHQAGIARQVTVPDTVRVVRQAFGRPITPRQVLFKAHRRFMRIPARPFLVVQDEDLQVLEQMVMDHLHPSREASGG